MSQCLDSLLAQTFQDFELLLVDDGSTDDSIQIEKRYEDKNLRVRLLLKEHSNAGDARNLGLENARGKYITFLDSDDFFEPDMLELKYIRAEKEQADICACNADHYNEQTGEYETMDFLPMRKYLSMESSFNAFDAGDHIFQMIFFFQTWLLH